MGHHHTRRGGPPEATQGESEVLVVVSRYESDRRTVRHLLLVDMDCARFVHSIPLTEEAPHWGHR